jgi:RNA recognition motif-containing protein
MSDWFTTQSIDISKGKFTGILTNFRFGYIDFDTLESAKLALDLHGTKYQGRPLVVDTDKGNAKAGYRARGNWDGHTKYNQKVQRNIKKNKEINEATSKIKNYNPLRKVDRYEVRDKQRALKR